VIIASFGAVLVLAAVHALAARLGAIHGDSRRRWLSVASGVAVAFLFVHMVPLVAAGGEALAAAGVGVQAPTFILALAGVIVFYGLERAAKRSKKAADADRTSREIFLVHLVAFAGYNAIIGHLLVVEEHQSLPLFTAAIAIHFAVVDYGLEDHHQEPYVQYGRWVLVGAIIAGWAVSYLVVLPQAVIASLFAFITGAMVLNVLKEELPEKKERRFVPFVSGAAVCTLLLQWA
jgi:zinc transporter ZupT